MANMMNPRKYLDVFPLKITHGRCPGVVINLVGQAQAMTHRSSIGNYSECMQVTFHRDEQLSSDSPAGPASHILAGLPDDALLSG